MGASRAAADLRAAVSFLTVLPVAPRETPREMAPARAYFPLVGLAIGGLLAGLDAALRQAFPRELVAALDLATLVVLTRAIHVEGFVDSCDALFGGYSRERRLEILRDPHVGSFGVVGAVALLLVQWAALAALPGRVRLEVLVLAPCLSRWAILLAMDSFPYARPQGMGTAFRRGRTRAQVAAGFITALASSLGLAGLAGLAMLGLATAASGLVGRWTASLLGGLTGDSYGAVNELATVAVLVLAVGLAGEAASVFGAPFYDGA